MSFNNIKPTQDPFAFGNALIEYKNGKPIGKVPVMRSSYQPSFGALNLSNQNDGELILELEDDE